MADDVEYPPNCLPILYTNGISELVKRLKILSEALQASDTNDECGQPDRYRTLICHLSDSRFLANSSKDVQIWLACCLADILRIFAPNVPLGDPTQLKVSNYELSGSIVHLVAFKLKHAFEKSEKRQMKVLLLMMTEKTKAKAGIRQVFCSRVNLNFYLVFQVIALLIGIISKLLRDVDQVSAEILDVLFFYLINPQKVLSQTFHFFVRLYFLLLRGQISCEYLISSPKTFTSLNQITLKSDGSAAITTVSMIEVISHFSFFFSAALGSLTRDLDDSVRHTAVLCIIETARKKLEAVNESLIVACCDRMKDKKPKVRQDVITKLLHLYYKVVMGDEYTMSEIAAVAIIPKRALALYMLATKIELPGAVYYFFRLMIERYFSSYIIPYKMEMPKRVRSMVDLFDKLDEFEAQVFAEIVTRSSRHRRILREMLEIISRQTASDDKAQLQSKIQRISSTHHDPAGVSHFTFNCHNYHPISLWSDR
ncbi:unnamed protein product [Haemonchus placei]|uniref:Adaptin_N domain-containing protein n=1 Tax=Haemonchus placei TaxID=6290 RepID=A0A0N4W335_HAEPC|nr:unnamed protein product [Haemonchus placei]